MIASFYTANRLGLQLSTAASQVAGGCCAYTQRTYPNGHALGDRVPTASTGPSRPLLHMRLKAFAGPFGVCYQVVTRTTWQLVAVSDSQLRAPAPTKLLLPSRLHARPPAVRLPCWPAAVPTRPCTGSTRTNGCPGTRGHGSFRFQHQFAHRIRRSANAPDPLLDDDDDALLRHRFSACL